MNGRICFVPPEALIDLRATDVTAAVQALYDLALSSMDFRSGFWTAEDAAPVAALALACGFEQREAIQKYHDDQLEQEQRSAFMCQNLDAIYPRRGFRDQYLAQAEALRAHEHVFSTLGTCMWPGCGEKE